jgi:hypothetical protein
MNIPYGKQSPPIAYIVECSNQNMRQIRTTLALFDNSTAPPNRISRYIAITPLMRGTLCERMQHPGLSPYSSSKNRQPCCIYETTIYLQKNLLQADKAVYTW